MPLPTSPLTPVECSAAVSLHILVALRLVVHSASALALVPLPLLGKMAQALLAADVAAEELLAEGAVAPVRHVLNLDMLEARPNVRHPC